MLTVSVASMSLFHLQNVNIYFNFEIIKRPPLFQCFNFQMMIKTNFAVMCWPFVFSAESLILSCRPNFSWKFFFKQKKSRLCVSFDLFLLLNKYPTLGPFP